jgi:predicted metal-dependent hydrolase
MTILQITFHLVEGEGTPSFWQKYGPTFLSSLLGTGLTLSMFALNNRKEKKNEAALKEKTQNEKLKYLASLLESSIKIAKEQIGYLNTAVKLHNPIKLTQLFRRKLTHIFAGVKLHDTVPSSFSIAA